MGWSRMRRGGEHGYPQPKLLLGTAFCTWQIRFQQILTWTFIWKQSEITTKKRNGKYFGKRLVSRDNIKECMCDCRGAAASGRGDALPGASGMPPSARRAPLGSPWCTLETLFLLSALGTYLPLPIFFFPLLLLLLLLLVLLLLLLLFLKMLTFPSLLNQIIYTESSLCSFVKNNTYFQGSLEDSFIVTHLAKSHHLRHKRSNQQYRMQSGKGSHFLWLVSKPWKANLVADGLSLRFLS